MCMLIKRSIQTKKPNKDGFYTGWKVVTKANFPIFFYQGYNIGENISSRSYCLSQYSSELLSNQLTLKEIIDQKVDYGFHICLDRKDARLANQYSSTRRKKIIKVYYKREDVLAYGVWSDDKNVKQVVVDKMTIKSFEGVG